jgi:chemotaxis protein MotB
MRRPRYHFTETTHNQDRWLLTYADMITLLTAFFLMLYSMSVMSKGKFSQLAVSVRSSFSGAPGTGNRDSDPNPSINQLGLPTADYQNYGQAVLDLRHYVEQTTQPGSVATRSDERGVVISLVADKMLFERGSAEIRAQSAPILERVAQVLRTNSNRVMIEGHTCDLPIHTAQFPSNWELSTARAAMLLRYFTERQGLPAARFTAAGYADTRPVAPNTSDANRARNRRVDIVILKTDARREVDLALRAEIRRITVDGAAAALPFEAEMGAQAEGGTPATSTSAPANSGASIVTGRRGETGTVR